MFFSISLSSERSLFNDRLLLFSFIGRGADFNSQLQRQFTAYAQAREKDTQTLHVLEAAMKAYTNSTTAPPSPPLSPSPASSFPTSSLTSEYIIQALQDPITDVLRAKMKPLIQEFRDNVEGLLKDQNAEMYGTIWERVKGALILLRTISDKLEVGQQQGVVEVPG